MKRKLAAVVAGVLLTTGGGAAVSSAVSPSEQQCNGTFSRDQGQVSCTTTEEGKNTKFTETQQTTGQGNTSNKQQQSTTCGGTGSDKCPPGQF
jgi:hypothetical protein